MCPWACRLLLGDDLFSAPKTSWSLSNSDLGHLRYSLNSNCLWVPETLRSTSYSKPLPAVLNATACSFHSDPSPDTSKGNPETSLVSAPSDLNSAPMLFGDSLSCNGVRATPAASDIKDWVIKVIHDVQGQWWSGSMGNAGWWPWS